MPRSITRIKVKDGPWDGRHFRFDDMQPNGKPIPINKTIPADGGTYHLFDRGGARWFQWVASETETTT